MDFPSGIDPDQWARFQQYQAREFHAHAEAHAHAAADSPPRLMHGQGGSPGGPTPPGHPHGPAQGQFSPGGPPGGFPTNPFAQAFSDMQAMRGEMQGSMQSMRAMFDQQMSIMQAQLAEVRMQQVTTQQAPVMIQQDVLVNSISQAMRSGSQKIDAVKPVFYSGQKNACDLDLWISSVETYHELKGVHEDRQLLSASQFLSDTAALWYNSRQDSVHDKITTWPELAQGLKATFQALDRHEEAMKQLVALSSGEHKLHSVREYSLAFQAALTTVETDKDCKVGEKLKIFLFRNGLKLFAAQKQIVQTKPTTLPEAMKVAVETSNIHVNLGSGPSGSSTQGGKLLGGTRQGGDRNNGGAVPMDLGSMVQRPTPTAEEKEEFDRRRSEGLCMRCGGNHAVKDCTNGPVGTFAVRFDQYKKAMKQPPASRTSGNGRAAGGRSKQ